MFELYAPGNGRFELNRPAGGRWSFSLADF